MRRAIMVMLLAAVPAAPVPASAAAPVTIALEGRPMAGAAVGGRLWVLVDRAGERRAVEVDPARRRPTGRSVRIGAAGPGDGPRQHEVVSPPPLVVVRGALWTLDAPRRTAVRIDTVHARLAARVRVPVDAIAVGEGGLWALGPLAPLVVDRRRVGWLHRVLRIDPRTGAVRAERRLGPGIGVTRFDRFAVGRDRVWLSAPSSSGRTGIEVEWDGVGARPAEGWRFTAHAGALFTADIPCTMIVRPGIRGAFQREMRMLRPLLCDNAPAGRVQPQDVAAGPGGAAWELFMRGVGPGIGRLTGLVSWRRIDGSGPLRTVVVGRDAFALVPDGDGVWVVDRAAGRLTRITG